MRFPPAARFVGLCLALGPVALAHESGAPNFVEVVLRGDAPLPGGAPNSSIERLRDLRGGANGGWVVCASALDGSNPVERSFLLGQRASQTASPPVILREAQALSGYAQGSLILPSIAGSNIAYLEADSFNASSGRSVWLDDQLLFEAGDTVPGTGGMTWSQFHQVELSAAGTALIVGEVTPLLGGAPVDVLTEWPSGTVLLKGGDSIPGMAQPFDTFRSGLEVSPSGNHWSIVAREQMGFWALVVDGSVLETSPGYFVQSNRPVQPDFAGGSTSFEWATIYPALVNDAGDYAFSASYRHTTLPQVRSGVFRNGRRVTHEGRAMVGLDKTGAILAGSFGSEFSLETYPAVAGSPIVADVSGNGLPDANYEFRFSAFGRRITRPNGQSGTLILGSLRNSSPTIPTVVAVTRGRDYRVDRPVCAGVPNSTGEAAQVVGAGSVDVTRNDLILQVFGLPVNAPGFVLVSRSFGVAMGPGGSQGNLCLSGSIGRVIDQVYTSNFEGRATVRIDLGSIPQPNGPAAALAGETWFAQSWYRDAVQGVATSNFSSASAITFD